MRHASILRQACPRRVRDLAKRERGASLSVRTEPMDRVSDATPVEAARMTLPKRTQRARALQFRGSGVTVGLCNKLWSSPMMNSPGNQPWATTRPASRTSLGR